MKDARPECVPATGAADDGEELSNFEPGSEIAARVTILAEGTLGHLTRRN